MSNANTDSEPMVPQTPLTPEDVRNFITDLPFREPIVDYYDPLVHREIKGESYWETMKRFDDAKQLHTDEQAAIDKQWTMVTEAARRAILRSPEARKAVSGTVFEPISEVFPLRAMNEIAGTDPVTAKALLLTKRRLGILLGLDQVPVELIKPDISNAPDLKTAELEIQPLLSWFDMPDFLAENPDFLPEQLKRVKESVKKWPGITWAEKDLAARRFRYARDVKLLGLMSELIDEPVTESKNAHEVVRELPSGTRLVMDRSAYTDSPNLLNPQNWENRQQLKDRVYIVTVAGEQYILKERKTPYHTDTKEHGHIDGLTAAEEFETAQKFANLGETREGDVVVRWEKPLGYAEFPDGYQFSIFEKEPELISHDSISIVEGELYSVIVEAKAEFQDEFEQIKKAAQAISEERDDLLFVYKDPEHNKTEENELSFEQFAELKARNLRLQAENLLSDTIHKQGYINNDSDGFAYRVIRDKKPYLEIVGFDFEYYEKDPKRAKEVLQRVREHREDGSDTRWLRYTGASIAYVPRVKGATDYAMMEQIGLKMPPIEG